MRKTFTILVLAFFLVPAWGKSVGNFTWVKRDEGLVTIDTRFICNTRIPSLFMFYIENEQGEVVDRVEFRIFPGSREKIDEWGFDHLHVVKLQVGSYRIKRYGKMVPINPVERYFEQMELLEPVEFTVEPGVNKYIASFTGYHFGLGAIAPRGPWFAEYLLTVRDELIPRLENLVVSGELPQLYNEDDEKIMRGRFLRRRVESDFPPISIAALVSLLNKGNVTDIMYYFQRDNPAAFLYIWYMTWDLPRLFYYYSYDEALYGYDSAFRLSRLAGKYPLRR
jgi:hypothetical protein